MEQKSSDEATYHEPNHSKFQFVMEIICILNFQKSKHYYIDLSTKKTSIQFNFDIYRRGCAQVR